MRRVLFAIGLTVGPVQAGQIDTGTFNALRRGMYESEVLVRAGEPDMITEVGGGALGFGDYGARLVEGATRIRLHYIPGPEEHDPWLSIITVTNGVVTALERRKVFGEMSVPPSRIDDPDAPVVLRPQRQPATDDDIRRERADRTLDAAQRYSEVRTRLREGAAAPDGADARPLYQGTDEAGVPYFGDVPATRDAGKAE